MKTNLTVLSLALIAAVALSGPASAANGLEVTMGAALTGTYGLEVTADGADSNAAYVATNAPSAESGARIQFQVKPTTPTPLDLGPAKNIRIMQALSTFPKPPNASSVQHLIVFLKRNFLQDNYRIRVMAQQNFGFFQTCAEFFLVVDGGPAKTVAIEWVQGEGAQGSQDGRCSVYVNDVLQGEKTNLNTSEFNINEIRFGVFQPDVSASGSYFLDDVVITRIQ